MDDARIATSEKLLAEMAWVRQLARALIKDAALADDVAQDTWVVAAERQPDSDQPLRPWLARVVKNLVHTGRRSDVRRRQREAGGDDGRTARTPAELVEQVELQRAVADEVLALAEPYRSTVLLHFVDGLSSAEIARRLAIPNGTVRRRLKVAVDQLREALAGRNDQPKRGWIAALVPFAMASKPQPASAAIGAIAMKKIIALVLLLLLLLAVGGGVLWHHRSKRDEVAAGGGASSAAQHRGSVDGRGASTEMTPIPDWIPQTGAPARRIAGRVVFQGKPIAGARVTLGFETFAEIGAMRITTEDVSVMAVLQRVAEVRSATDGTFDFGVQPGARFTVSASADNYSTGAVVVDNANPKSSSDRLIVRLASCGIRLSGTVSDASGGGIAKATVTVDAVERTETDANGSYRVCASPKIIVGMPSVEVRVEADGYGTTHETVLAVADIQHNFLLVPEAILVGRVTTKSGEAVAGARVVAMAEPQELPHHVASGFAYSDQDGRFRIARLAPGAFQLFARAKAGNAPPIPVFAQPTSTSREIQLVLDSTPLARVRGHVFKGNAPASGVSMQAVGDGTPGGSTVSQTDGSFVLERMPYGKIKFYVSPNWAEASAEVDIARPEVDDVRIDIKKAASIHGRVTRKGKPVEGVDVLYMSPPQATFFGRDPQTKTDASGAYALEIPAGQGQLSASDYSQKAFSFRPIDVPAGEDKAMDIELDSAGEVVGVVVNEAGGPVAGVYMRLDLTDGSGDMCESITDANGRFDCALLIGGEYRPTVTPSPGARRGFTPAAGAQFNPIQVPRDGVVSGVQLAIKDERFAIGGTVVDDTGSPMSDVHVMAMAPGESTMDFPSTLTDASGRFEIANLARGTYSLSAHAANGSDGVVPGVAAGTKTASIKLARAGAIEGTLTGFASTATVFFWSATRGAEQSGRALVEGAKFSRAGVTPGRYMIEAMSGADADAVTIEVRAGETVHVDLRSRATGTVEGTVADLATRKPIAAMRCDAKPSTGGQTSPVPPDVAFQAFTDAAGHFKVSAPIGRVRIFCFPTNGVPLSAAGTDVDVTSAQPAKVNVFSVRAAASPSDAGFMIAPGLLPITVADVVPNGPAATAGLRAGDQLVTIDGISLQGVLPQGAMFLVTNHRAGTVATLGIVRGAVSQTIKISVGGAGSP
jgi:RNA polymerase sigma factor (sigma-70 family)